MAQGDTISIHRINGRTYRVVEGGPTLVEQLGATPTPTPTDPVLPTPTDPVLPTVPAT